MEKMSNTALNRIGDVIRAQKHDSDYKNAVETLNNWREAHGKLMDEYYDKCVKITQTESTKNILVAQRLKRLPTIIDKLDRFENMSLSRMQDIAGVRMIVRDMKQLSQIENRLKRWRYLDRISHDYINEPKEDGYRSKHFIFKKDGMFVEIQLRTQVQHIWATSVETIDVFRGSSMKTNKEQSYWYDFFRQTSSAFAIAEGTPPVKEFENTSLSEMCVIIEETIKKHKINQSLQAIEISRQAKNMVRGAYYLVLDLDFANKVCKISSFEENDYDLAVKKYQKLEQTMKKNNSIVLVSVNDIKRLDGAYPNYFLNLRYFNELIKYLLEKNNKKD